VGLPNQLPDALNWLAGDPDSIASYAGNVATASNGETIDPRATSQRDAIDDQHGLTIKGPPAADADGPRNVISPDRGSPV
jgi:hypothetical protein